MADIDLERLRLLLDSASGECICTATPLSDDTALALIDGELSGVAREQVMTQVTNCPACARVLRDMLQASGWSDAFLQQLAPAVATPIHSATHYRRSRWRNWLGALAATVVIATSAWVWQRVEPAANQDTEQMRAPKASITPADGAVLSAPPSRFQWPCERAEEARFELLDQRGEWILKQAVTQCSVELASPLAAGNYAWRVRNGLDDVQWGPFTFEVR